MQKYESPIIEIEYVEVLDVVTTSINPGENPDELPFDPASFSGSTGSSSGKITIGGGSTGGFSAGDLFGNR